MDGGPDLAIRGLHRRSASGRLSLGGFRCWRSSWPHAPRLQVEREAVVVDDGSVDGHHRSDRGELARGQGRIRGVRLRRRFGKSAALAAGFDHARGATIVTIDGDGQDDPADIPALLDALGGGADLVSGWKRRPPRSTDPQSRLPALQLGDRALHRRRHARHEQRLQGLPRGVRQLARGLRGDAPVPAGAGRPAGVARDRGAGQPPGPQLRQLSRSAPSATCAALSTS